MIRILLAEDHPVVREGLRALLESEDDFLVVAQTGDGSSVPALVKELRPDLVVLDMVLPGMRGLEILPELARESPQVRVVILSMHSNEAYVLEALRSGAAGYVLKQSEPEELVRAIRAAVAGRRYLSPPLSERAVEAYARRATQSHSDPYHDLTPRQRQVLQMVAEGRTNIEIAHRLSISPRTVETHRATLMKRLGVRTQAEVVRFAVVRGLVPADPSDPPTAARA